MELLNRVIQNKHFKAGGPLVIGLVGGAYCLSFYSQARYEAKDDRQMMVKFKDVTSNMPVQSVEEIYEEHIKESNLNDWENIRVPRPEEMEPGAK